MPRDDRGPTTPPGAALRFQSVQRDFAAYIRNPDGRAVPAGVDPRRMDVYASLVYRNLEGFLSRAFRVAREILGDARWHAMVRDFIDRHASQSPYFRDISTEFLNYLEAERDVADDPPFLAEICQYAWVRRSLDQADEVLPAAPDGAMSDAALLDSGFAVSPLAWPLRYRFPVHRIGVDFQPVEAPAAATWLIVYRDRGDRVGYMESNPATTRLLALLGEGGTAREALSGLAGELGRDAASLLGFGATVLRRLVEQDIAVPVSCEGVPPSRSSVSGEGIPPSRSPG